MWILALVLVFGLYFTIKKSPKKIEVKFDKEDKSLDENLSITVTKTNIVVKYYNSRITHSNGKNNSQYTAIHNVVLTTKRGKSILIFKDQRYKICASS